MTLMLDRKFLSHSCRLEALGFKEGRHLVGASATCALRAARAEDIRQR